MLEDPWPTQWSRGMRYSCFTALARGSTIRGDRPLGGSCGVGPFLVPGLATRARARTFPSEASADICNDGPPASAEARSPSRRGREALSLREVARRSLLVGPESSEPRVLTPDRAREVWSSWRRARPGRARVLGRCAPEPVSWQKAQKIATVTQVSAVTPATCTGIPKLPVTHAQIRRATAVGSTTNTVTNVNTTNPRGINFHSRRSPRQYAAERLCDGCLRLQGADCLRSLLLRGVDDPDIAPCCPQVDCRGSRAPPIRRNSDWAE